MTKSDKLRLVFMGTPDLAAVILNKVLAWPQGEVVAVYTQPDRPAGRGKHLQASPVKTLALEHGLEIRQPLNFKNPADITALAELKPDFLLVAAYGLILPQAVLEVPRFAPVNVHASLLPKYRGAAPIQRAVMAGETETGISIMRMEAGLDTGPVYAMRSIPISADDTAGTVHDALAGLGGLLLLETLPGIASGEIRAVPQDDNLATYAAKLSKADGQVNFNQAAQAVHDHVRGVSPWPGAWCELQRDAAQGNSLVRVRVCPGRVADSSEIAILPAVSPGTVQGLIGNQLAIQCADGVYLIPQVCPAHRKMMGATEFACGYLNNAEACKAVGLDHG